MALLNLPPSHAPFAQTHLLPTLQTATGLLIFSSGVMLLILQLPQSLFPSYIYFFLTFLLLQLQPAAAAAAAAAEGGRSGCERGGQRTRRTRTREDELEQKRKQEMKRNALRLFTPTNPPTSPPTFNCPNESFRIPKHRICLTTIPPPLFPSFRVGPTHYLLHIPYAFSSFCVQFTGVFSIY